MNTSSEAIKQLQESLAAAQKAADTIENLIATHDYQDIAMLVTHSAAKMLESATLLMEKDDEAALDVLEDAEDLIDEVYKIIGGDIEMEDE
ncbi:MAG: hypothetical protein AAFV33_19435 [Chloroflexota bacterium]